MYRQGNPGTLFIYKPFRRSDMIESVSVKNFKGQIFDQQLEQFNLFVGDNGAGKSARSQAIQLLLTGYVPGTSKVSHQIVSNFSSGEFYVSGKINGIEYERKYTTSKAGNTSVSFRISKRRSDKTEFAEKAGNFPACFDMRNFTELSDAKKLEYIFSILPNLKIMQDLDEKTEKARAEYNQAVQDEKNIRHTLQKLSEAHAQYDVAGDLLTVEQDVKAAEAELEAVKADIEKQKSSEIPQKIMVNGSGINNSLQKIMSAIEQTCGSSCAVYQIARRLQG